MAKETLTTVIKTTVVVAAFVVTLTTTVFLGGSRIGRTEKTVEVISECLGNITVTAEKHDIDISNIKVEQAYQKGVIEAKLSNLEKTVDEIKTMLSQWEPD